MAKKDKKLCWECQKKPVDYVTSSAKDALQTGLCRDCYELEVSRQKPGTHRSYSKRTAEMKENTYETKHGPWHG